MTAEIGFSFGFHKFMARSSGALWWPDRKMLIVSDLHLGRTDRMARRGGALLPPWHDIDTLSRLQTEITHFDPQIVVSLGDSFDDDLAANTLSLEVRDQISDLAKGRDWIWIDGNHDPAPLPAGLVGRKSHTLFEDEILLIHASQKSAHFEISGHYHPVFRWAGRRWKCFARGERQLILPSFGSYTGGLAVDHPDFHSVLPEGIAICCSEHMFALPFKAPRALKVTSAP